MGWYIIMEPSTVKTAGQMCIDVEDWEEFEIAFSNFRRYRNRIVFIPHGVKEAPEFNPFNTGLFHFAYKIQTLRSLKNCVLWRKQRTYSRILSK
jgi:hypothetical protein